MLSYQNSTPKSLDEDIKNEYLKRIIDTIIVWVIFYPLSLFKYRDVHIFGTPEVLEVNIKGNGNLCKSHYCAKNAIDDYYGDFGEHGTDKRKRYGIQIIGRKKEKGLPS